MSLQYLPAEIIYKIIEGYPQTEFIGLLKTCQNLHSVLEPVFYESINMSSFSYMKTNAYSDFPPLHLLLRTLLNRPELGGYAKQFGPWGKMYFNKNDEDRERQMSLHITKKGIRDYDEQDLKLLDDRAHALSIGKHGFALWKSLADSNLQTFTRLLLSFYPYIRRIYSTADFRSTFTPRDSLTHVHIASNEHRLLWNSSVVRLIFSLPNIESIALSVYPGRTGKTDWPDVRAPTLRKLHLSSSSLFEESIGCLLSSAPNLKSLYLDLTWGCDTRSSALASGILDFGKLGKAFTQTLVQPEQDSSGASRRPSKLENLSLHVEFEIRKGYNHYVHEHSLQQMYSTRMTGNLGSFKEFTCLKTLDTHPAFLFGSLPITESPPLKEILPNSLTSLVLSTIGSSVGLKNHWGHLGVRDHFQKYLQDHYVGRLESAMLFVTEDQSVIDQNPEKRGDNVDVEWQELRAICERCGIALSWNSLPYGYQFYDAFG